MNTTKKTLWISEETLKELFPRCPAIHGIHSMGFTTREDIPEAPEESRMPKSEIESLAWKLNDFYNHLQSRFGDNDWIFETLEEELGSSTYHVLHEILYSHGYREYYMERID